MNTTVYLAPDAVGSKEYYFFDGVFMYERIQGLGSLGALHGWLKKIGKKLKKGVRSVGKGIKKVAKKSWKVIKKAIPIANTVLTFVPGIGWAAKAALTLAEMGIKATEKAQNRKKIKLKLKKQMQEWNRKTTRLAKPAKPVTKVIAEAKPQKVKPKPIKITPVKPPPVYTINDFIKINQALQKKVVRPSQVASLVKQINEERLQPVLNF